MVVNFKFDLFGVHVAGFKVDVEQPAPWTFTKPVGTLVDGLLKTEVVPARGAYLDRVTKWVSRKWVDHMTA